MGELFLSQPINVLLGGVTRDRDAFASPKERLLSAMERTMACTSMERVDIAHATDGMSEEEAFWFDWNVAVQVGFLHPDIRSIATPRLTVAEQTPNGRRVHFQIEGHFEDGRSGVSTVTFVENPRHEDEGIVWESAFGDPEEVGRIDGAKPFDLKDVAKLSEFARERFERMVICAALVDRERKPKLTWFDGSEAYVGSYRRVNAKDQREIVMQHPGERTSGNRTLVTFERAVFYSGEDPEIDSPIEVRYESVPVDELYTPGV